MNKELPEEIVECLKKEGCIPQYDKRIEGDITIPCLHLKSNRQVIWFIKYNFEEDLITIRTPDYNDKDWYSENNLKALLPSNIIFERGRKGRFIFKDLQTSELLKCIPVLVKWITERNKDIKKEGR